MSVVIGMTTDDDKKKEELKKIQEELSRELKNIKETPPSMSIDAFVGLEEKAKKTKREIRDLEML